MSFVKAYLKEDIIKLLEKYDYINSRIEEYLRERSKPPLSNVIDVEGGIYDPCRYCKHYEEKCSIHGPMCAEGSNLEFKGISIEQCRKLLETI